MRLHELALLIASAAYAINSSGPQAPGVPLVLARMKHAPVSSPNSAAPLHLNVLDRETGMHLKNVTVLRRGMPSMLPSDRAPLTDPYGRTAGYKLATKASSPLVLVPKPQDSRSLGMTYFVHSPGFAWKGIQVNVQRGGEREVRLERGGDLHIDLSGDEVDVTAYLRVRRVSGEIETQVANLWARGTRTFDLEGLPTGQYRAAIEVADPSPNPVVLGEISFELEAGKLTSRDLRVTAVPERQRALAELSGVLVVPPEWKFTSFYLANRSVDPVLRQAYWNSSSHSAELKVLDKSAGTWAFEFGALPIGPYELELDGGEDVTGYLWKISITAEGLTDLKLVVPPPALVHVRLQDSEGLAIQDPPRLRHGSPSRLNGHGEEADPKPDTSEYEIRAPLGNVSLSTGDGEYLGLDEDVEVSPGRNEFTFTLQKSCRFTVHLFDGSTPVPISGAVEYEGLDGGDRGKAFSFPWVGIPFVGHLAVPGMYALDIPTIDGFEPIPRQLIRVERGELTEHVIQLVRD